MVLVRGSAAAVMRVSMPGYRLHRWHPRTSFWQGVARPARRDSLMKRPEKKADARSPHSRLRASVPGKNPAMSQVRQTIVIVEDDPGVGSALMRGLAARGYHTELFETSLGCLNAIVTRVAACFVIDVHLGRDCGIDLSKRLAALGLKTPVIHMSGGATENVRRQALESGSIAFLDKPFAIPELVSIIESVTGRSAT